MNKKELIKKIIGPVGIEAVRKIKMMRGIFRAYKAGTIGHCEIKDPQIKLVPVLTLYNRFFSIDSVYSESSAV